jgi:hypothetical protein
VGKPEGKTSLGRSLCRWNDDIKIIPQKWDRAWTGSICLMRLKWMDLAKKKLMFRVTQNARNYFID